VLTSRVQENLAGVRVIRAYNQEGPKSKPFPGITKIYFAQYGMIKIHSMFYPLLFMLAGTIIFSFLFRREIGYSGELSLGTLVAFFAYLAILIWPMIALGWVISLYHVEPRRWIESTKYWTLSPPFTSSDAGN